MRITFFRNLEHDAKCETILEENFKHRENLGARECQLIERVNDLHNPKADRIPTNPVEVDKSHLNSDDIWDLLGDIIKDGINKELRGYDYNGNKDSAEGEKKDFDAGHQFKVDIPELVNPL